MSVSLSLFPYIENEEVELEHLQELSLSDSIISIANLKKKVKFPYLLKYYYSWLTSTLVLCNITGQKTTFHNSLAGF